MQREQFQSNLDSELRVWLIDQKPKNLSEAARLADQYVAVRKADRSRINRRLQARDLHTGATVHLWRATVHP